MAKSRTKRREQAHMCVLVLKAGHSVSTQGGEEERKGGMAASASHTKDLYSCSGPLQLLEEEHASLVSARMPMRACVRVAASSPRPQSCGDYLCVVHSTSAIAVVFCRLFVCFGWGSR